MPLSVGFRVGDPVGRRLLVGLVGLASSSLDAPELDVEPEPDWVVDGGVEGEVDGEPGEAGELLAAPPGPDPGAPGGVTWSVPRSDGPGTPACGGAGDDERPEWPGPAGRPVSAPGVVDVPAGGPSSLSP